MPSRLFSRDSGATEQQEQQPLPFTNDDVNEADFAHDAAQAENGGHSQPRRIAANTLAGSYTRNPIRSFAHQTSHSFAGVYALVLTFTHTPTCQQRLTLL